MQVCVTCGAHLSGRQTKFCSRLCHDSWKWATEREAREGRVPELVCRHCGAAFRGRVKPGRQCSYCSDECRSAAASARNSAGAKRRLRERLEVEKCLNPHCDAQILPLKGKQYCSPLCLYIGQQIRRYGPGAGDVAAIAHGMISACRIYYFDCVDCQAVTVKRYKRAGKIPCCRPCARRRYLEHIARKSHKRRAAGPPVLSVYQIAERDGRKCSVCTRTVDMTLSGKAKWGPTIEHLVPVSRGGTNHAENLALSHRHCNTSRGNRGHVQLLMTA